MVRNDSSGLDTCIPELDMYPLLFLVLVLGGGGKGAAIVNLLIDEKYCTLLNCIYYTKVVTFRNQIRLAGYKSYSFQQYLRLDGKERG
jgi:hypothetical protein